VPCVIAQKKNRARCKYDFGRISHLNSAGELVDILNDGAKGGKHSKTAMLQLSLAKEPAGFMWVRIYKIADYLRDST
jgi:hypothetical protein